MRESDERVSEREYECGVCERDEGSVCVCVGCGVCVVCVCGCGWCEREWCERGRESGERERVCERVSVW